MPALNRKGFKRSPCAGNLKPDDSVFFLPLTKEVFTSFDEFFQRQIALSSMIWTCTVTGKTGLTYEEALESEKNAQCFPENFGKPILYLVEKLSCRGRVDDLVNDIYYFVKDHFLVGEEVIFSRERGRKLCRILTVRYNDDDTVDALVQQSPVKKAAVFVKRGELLIGSAERYTYNIVISDERVGDFDDRVRENVPHQHLMRNKSLWSRNMLRLFLKNSCTTDKERLVVKRELTEELQLDKLSWCDVFGGPVVQFPRTPLMHRGPTKGVPRVLKSSSIASTSRPECGSDVESVEECNDAIPDGKPNNCEKITGTALGENKKIEKGRGRKKKKFAIAKQQEELEYLFEQARRMCVKDISKWQQDERILSNSDIIELKQIIRKAKEEARKRERDSQFEWRKPRDDVRCDDLVPLPDLPPLKLPDWMSPDDFGDFLYIFQFFESFPELLPIKEVRGTSQITFGEIVDAVRCSSPCKDALFVQLLHILLKAKSERADEEDGDEANLFNKDEISLDPNNDIDNKVFGDKVREATLFHERIRLTHGLSARHLPVDWMTLTEVLRLSLLTSGYYTGTATHRFRLFSRGGPRCYEDEGFIFANTNPQTMRTLEHVAFASPLQSQSCSSSIFDLKPHERMALLKVLVQQLQSYHKFRSTVEERITSLTDARKELKNLRNFDVTQDKEARESRLLREYEAEKIEEFGEAARTDFTRKSTPSSKTLTLTNYLKSSYVSRRDGKLRELEELLMSGVSYGELDSDEIEKARSLQKEHISSLEANLLSTVFRLQSRLGCHLLGRDRAFRLYWYIEPLSLLLVENVSTDDRGECNEPTPLNKVKEEYQQTCSNSDQLRRMLLGCLATEDCPAHGRHHRPRWQFIDSLETLEKVEAACNGRGFREMELVENIRFFKPLLTTILNSCSRKIASKEFYVELMLEANDPAEATSEFDFHKEFVDMLLDLEEKVQQGAIGNLSVYDSCNRDDWRRSLLENRSVACFVKDDVKVFGEAVLEADDVHSLDSVGQLAVAFLQIVQGINLKFLRLPFATPSSKDADCVNMPTTTFDQWQKMLLKCSSVSALSLFYETLEPGILWSKSRLQAKCRICKKRGDADKLCMCIRCDRCYHTDCMKPKIKKREEWMCTDCRTMLKAKAAEEKWRKRQEQSLLKRDENREYEEENDEITPGTSTDGFAEPGLPFEEEFELPPDMLKTSSGRVVKKVVYSDESMVEDKKISKKRNRTDVDSEDDNNTNDTDYHRSRKKRAKNSNKRSSGAATMNLRETDHRTRDALKALEVVIGDSMRQESAWPFVEPVDGKIVPDYHQIVKRPMDLRTMMNKLKQRSYDRPDQVVADAHLIFDNCRLYNEENSEICRCADRLERFLKERFDQILPSRTQNGQDQNFRL